MSGKFVMQGSKLGTTYPETGEATWDLIEDFYADQFKIAKSAGAATYSTDRGNGYTNAIYGKYITAAMFMTDNTFTALGAKPYQHEGVRIATELASYGLCTAEDINRGLTGFNIGDFIGIGATTVPDGRVPSSVKMNVGEFREPAKEVPFKFNYGLFLAAVENKDDTQSKQDYVDKMARNYSNEIDETLLRPISMKQPSMDGIETSLTGISRVVSSNSEIGRVADGVTLTAEMVSPYGGNTPAKGDFYNYRANGPTNLDSQIINLNNTLLSINAMRRLYRDCSVNWADSAAPNNKLWLMSNVAQDKLGALMQANQMLLNTVYVQRDFNGVKTIPGRDAGLVLQSFNNIPILQDGNLNFNYQTKKVSNVKFGDVFLLDLDHLWMSLLTPVQMYSVNNPAVTDIFQEVNVLHMRSELRVDSFIGSGKIVGLMDDEDILVPTP